VNSSFKIEDLSFLSSARSELIEGAVSISGPVSAVYFADYSTAYDTKSVTSYAITGAGTPGASVSFLVGGAATSSLGVAISWGIAVGGVAVAFGSTSATAKI